MTLDLPLTYGDDFNERGTRARKRYGTAGRGRLAWPAVVARCLVPLALAAAPFARAAESEVTAFRSEIIPFETADLPQQAFLSGGPTTKTRTIAGELSLPNTETPRVPAVIVLHGDGGLVPNHSPWVRALNRLGIAVFNVDSFSGRGTFAKAHGFVFIQGSANVASRMVDAYRALDLLSRHPRIDPDRIAVMGFSGGASAARYAAMQRFAGARAAPGQRFAAFVLVYPNCTVTLRDDAQLVKAPVRIHHGEADRMTSIDLCRDWVARAHKAGADIALRPYAGAGHGFDIPDGIPPVERPDAINVSRCRLRETDDGRLVNSDTGRQLDSDDACVGKGAGGGPHGAARVAATAEVTEFLVEVLTPR